MRLRAVRRLRSGTSRPASAAAGARPTSSACATGAWRATAATTSAAVVRVWSSMLVETWTRLAELQAERADAGQALGPALADAPPRCACASSSVAGGASSTLKATSGGAGGDERRARGRVQPRRAVVGREAGERAGRAQARARAPARERAVEVDGQAEVAAEPVGEQQRLGDGGAPLGVGAVDDRRDVERAHARVQRPRARSGRSARPPRARPPAAPRAARRARRRA